jgi:hypothetical protein
VLEQLATADQIIAVELVQETAVQPTRPMMSDVAWIYKKGNYALSDKSVYRS